MEVVKKVLEHINSTLDLGLFFKIKVNSFLVGFTNANFGRDLDDKRSTLDFFLVIKIYLIVARNKNSIFSSTTEAEYKVTTLVTQEYI